MKLFKLNPMVRAIGTMGAVTAIVGGVTFASFSTTAVKLTGNTLTSATATLAIATTCPTTGTTLPGLTATLVPGVASSPVSFCLDNTGQIPLAITAQVSPSPTGSLDPSKITLSLNCGTGNSISQPLDLYATATALTSGKLASGGTLSCSETATLDSSYTGSAQSLAAFDISFVGNQ